MMTANVAEMMFRPHAFAAGRNQACLRLPAIGADCFSRQEDGTIQLDTIEANITADLQSFQMFGFVPLCVHKIRQKFNWMIYNIKRIFEQQYGKQMTHCTIIHITLAQHYSFHNIEHTRKQTFLLRSSETRVVCCWCWCCWWFLSGIMCVFVSVRYI